MVSRRKRGKGLTITEILVAIALVSLMLVTTLVLFAQLLASTAKSGYLDIASLYADQLLEQAAGSPNPDSPAFSPLKAGEKEFLVHGDRSPTKFVYRLEATQVGEGTNIGERWLLQVEVRWWNDADSTTTSRAGYGELKTTQSRVVYAKW